MCSKNNSYPTPNISPGITCHAKTSPPNIPILHLAYFDATQIFHMMAVDGVWEHQPTALSNSYAPYGELNSSNYRAEYSFELDQNNKPNLVYLDNTGKYYHLRKDSSWQIIKTVETAFPSAPTTYIYSFISLAFDSQNNLKTIVTEDDKLNLLTGDTFQQHILDIGYADDYSFQLFTHHSLLTDNQNKMNWIIMDWYSNLLTNKFRHYVEDTNISYSYTEITNTGCTSFVNNPVNGFATVIDDNSKIHMAYTCDDGSSNYDTYYSTNKSGSWVHEKIYDNIIQSGHPL